MIKINANVTDSVSPMIRDFIAALAGSERAEINEAAGRAAVNAAISYHHEFNQGGGWKGKRYLGPSQGDGGDFGADVARGWNLQSYNSEGAVIANAAPFYAFKVTGGTITRKRASALTIPLIPEARGLHASVYQQNTGNKLFISKSKNALLERIQQLTTGSRGRRGQAVATTISSSPVRAVYALMKSVTMRPWPEAMPPDDRLADAFVEQFKLSIQDIIEKS
jgi:hypothetical protein